MRILNLILTAFGLVKKADLEVLDKELEHKRASLNKLNQQYGNIERHFRSSVLPAIYDLHNLREKLIDSGEPFPDSRVTNLQYAVSVLTDHALKLESINSCESFHRFIDAEIKPNSRQEQEGDLNLYYLTTN